MTDSIITKMYRAMQNGNNVMALALSDRGIKYAQMEEPQNMDKWDAFFACRKAQILLRGDIEEVEDFLNQQIIPENHSENSLYWWLLLITIKGDVYVKLGDYESAYDMYSLAYQSNREDSDSKTKYYGRISKLFYYTKQFDSANYYSQKLISLLKSEGDTLTQIYFESILHRASILAELGENEKSEILVGFIQSKYGGFLHANNYMTRIRVLDHIAYIKSISKDYVSALKYSHEIKRLFIHYNKKTDSDNTDVLFRLGYYSYYLNQKDSVYHYMKTVPKLLKHTSQKKTALLSLRGKEISTNKDGRMRNTLLFILDYFDNKYPDYNGNIYNYLLFNKRNTSQSLVELKTFYKEKISDTLLNNFFIEWQKNRTHYFNWLTSHELNEDSSKVLAKTLEIQEKKLYKEAGMDYFSSQKTINWKSISNKLVNHEIAIEFIRYMHLKTKERFYGALLVSPKLNSPIFVKLCKESELKDLLTYKFAETDYEYTQRVYRSNTLYNLIWKPLEPYLQKTKDCHVSLSGLLYKISLDATFSEDTPIQPTIHLLHSTAALVEEEPSFPKTPKVLLYGGVVYNLNKVKNINSLSSKVSEHVHSYHRGLRGHTWDYLKETEKEVKEISALLKKKGYQVQLNIGTACSENRLKAELKGNSPHILHIATHGYYPAKSDSVLSYTQTASYARSGLVMAGATNSKISKTPIKGFGDGILTAPEITALNLSNTQLVVLSACESGKGQISHVDEIYGLQRAFKIAGAKSVIYTLWKIPDGPSKDFMIYFYKMLTEGNTIKQSFFQTKLHMKKTHPVYHWAGFQLIE
jgi:CHAT domain-containing protein